MDSLDRLEHPFFIVGSGRSGTTLLRLILAGHSHIALPPETWFVLDLVDQFPLTTCLTREQVNSAIRVITGCYRWPDLNISAPEFSDRALALEYPTLADLIDVVFRLHLQETGKTRIGDKTPPYIAILPQLKQIYPNAKFINLIRDGRDVAISFVDAGFKGRCYHGAAFEWTRAIRMGMSYRSLPFASDILEIRYEELVSEPEKTVRIICKFLGETFESGMLAPETRIDLVPSRERSIHRKLSNSISSDTTEVWRTKLSALETFIMEASLGDDLHKLGYPLRFSSRVWRPFLLAARKIARVLAPVFDYLFPALRRRGLMQMGRYL